MEKRTWAKLIIAVLLIAVIAAGLYFRWSSAGQGSDPATRWGRGILTVSEAAYYSSRMSRIIKSWQQTKEYADFERDYRFKESYRTFLMIDIGKQAIWIEEDGHIQENNYTELPAGIKWELYHTTPQTNNKLTDRVTLKIRGLNSSQQTPERFSLIGVGREGSLFLSFNSTTLSESLTTGSHKMPTFSFKSSPKKEKELYGSLIVTDAEYQQYRQSLSGVALSQLDEGSDPTQGYAALEENKVTWQKHERLLYIEIDRQVRKKGYELRSITVEPGPDFSAGHAELRGHKDIFLRRFLGGVSSVEAYLNIDYLGNNIWYARSEAHPLHPIMPRRELDLEFLVCSKGELSTSKEKAFFKKGRQKQQRQLAPVPETQWKVALPDGAIVEFIGICGNPSAGKQWWGPDGSPLDYVPYINTEPYSRPREDRKIYEFAWRIQKPAGGGGIRYSMEGCTGSYGNQIRDRYGNRIMEGLSAHGYGFDNSRQKTTLKLGFAHEAWKTALAIEDATGETKFLGKQRIILNPAAIENGQIVVRCYEEYRSRVRDHQTDFGLIFKEELATTTIPLRRYKENITDNKDTGLREHKFIIDNLDMSQIEGVCFRYRPFGFVKFKNITLTPGKNQGFEIELGE